MTKRFIIIVSKKDWDDFMIIQFSVENFKSINKKVVFSMLAGSNAEHSHYLRNVGQFNILPSTLIIGANGAGKSNLFQAIKYLQKLLNNNKVIMYPHKLNKNDDPTIIDIQFIVNGKRYAYGVEILNNQVNSEYLYHFENGSQVMIFERDQNKIDFISKYETILRTVVDEDVSNILLLTLLSKKSNIELIKNAYTYLTVELIVILSDEEEETLLNYAINSFNKIDNQKVVNQLLSKLDMGINNFYYSEVDGVMVKYNKMDINIHDESTGTKKLFALLNLISEVINNGRVLLFDELEKNLHLNLVKYIIKLFNSSKKNVHNAQLIFSTHSTSLLDLSMFRQDQVWFMEKDFKNLNTELYSLTNILDIQKDENIERGYLLGKYGATFSVKLGELDEE
ncbi:MAG: putative ATPase [Haloplasmataceae bacterium]|jgi:AAA15 family ATPase/GTPase|nr:putative ATPase [Haloplasmataceae bacterium]